MKWTDGAMEMKQGLQKWIDEGEVLFIERKNYIHYGFRNGSKHETWFVWENEFDTVHPGSQWLVKLLIEAREHITGLQYARAKRFRRERLDIEGGTPTKKEKRRAKLQKEIEKLQRQKEELRLSISQMKSDRDETLSHRFSFHHETMATAVLNLKNELNTLKMRLWLKHGINAESLMDGEEE